MLTGTSLPLTLDFNKQTVVDSVNSKKDDLRRARSGMVNLAPTSTGSATAIALIFPELKVGIGRCLVGRRCGGAQGEGGKEED